MSSSTDSTTLPPLRLKKNEERRLRAGHLWAYSNEIDIAQTPLTAFSPGDAVELRDHRNGVIGTGYVNPHSLISARLVSRDAKHPLSASLLVHRLKIALALRERLYAEPYYRLAFGDSDGLPGLVVDRFADVLVVQITTAGMERMKPAVIEALDKVIKPAGILLRNDSPIRAMEGLEAYVEVALGEVPESVLVRENGVEFTAQVHSGQKTGWFYDHRDNRARLQRYVPGRRVLDLFSYVGAWGLQAAQAGAAEVLCVDASATALELLADNAQRNRLAERVHTRHGDAFEILRELREQDQHFDVIVLDPPAFIKRKKDVKEGVQAYRRLNQMAMQLLARDGILASCSCSFHLARDTLQTTLLQSARHLDRSMQILEQGHQAADHPVHPAIPETDYLKAFFVRVLPS